MPDNKPTKMLNLPGVINAEQLQALREGRPPPPPPPPTRIVRDPVLWQGVALGGLIAGIGALIVMILAKLLG